MLCVVCQGVWCVCVCDVGLCVCVCGRVLGAEFDVGVDLGSPSLRAS